MRAQSSGGLRCDGDRMPPAVLVGDLCRDLNNARDAKYVAERCVEDLLAEILPGWRLRFPRPLSWLWTPPGRIDVFEATATTAAAKTLRLAGFSTICLHDHPQAQFLSCGCRVEEVS